MDQGEILGQFMSMTGAEADVASFFLEANGYDLQTSINMYLEGNMLGASGGAPPPRTTPGGAQGGRAHSPVHHPVTQHPLSPAGGGNGGHIPVTNQQGGGGGGGDFDPRTMSDADIARAMSDIPPEMYDSAMYEADDGVRAPIMPHTETLVEDDPYVRLTRRRPPQASNNVFEMFRDFRNESRMTPKAGTDDQNTKKLKTLADLFRPPLDLLEAGSFDNVKAIAKQRRKWLLVNIQETSEFDCQKLNRDTWSDPGVKSVVQASFVLWQVLKTSEDGARYCRYYPVEILPHLAIIDSRTGERLEVFEGFVEPAQLIDLLEKFLQAHSFDDTNPTRPKPESPTKKLGDLSEEAQIAAAMAASLGQDGQQAAEAVLASTRKPAATPSAPATTTSTTTSTASTPAAAPTTTTTSTPAPAAETKPVAPAPVQTPVPTPTPTPAAAPVPEPAPSKELIDAHANPKPELTCTIQIRTPTGVIKGFFKPADTLRTVHQYTSLHLEPNKQFSLISAFPKKVFTGELLDMTLQQADLVPRATLNCEMS